MDRSPRIVLVAVSGRDSALNELASDRQLSIRRFVAGEPESIFEELAGGSPPPVAAVLDGTLPAVGSLARKVLGLAPLAQLIFAVPPDQAERVQTALRFVPLVGAHWMILPLGSRWREAIREQIAIGERRQRHRTTLNRVNLQLRDAPPVDAQRLHRLVVSERVLAAIVESAPDAVVTLSAQGEILSWNASAETLWRTPAFAAMGQKLERFLSQGSRSAFHTALHDVVRENRFSRHELAAESADGELVPLELTLTPVLDEERHVAAFSVIARDITERKRAQKSAEDHQRQLEALVSERTAQLRETIAQLEQFSYTVSHDLRGPLRAMQGYAAALLKDFGRELPAEAVEYAKRIARAAVRLDRLVQDVLAYSRVASVALEKAPVDLDHLVTELIAQHARPQHGAETFHVQHPLGRVWAHEALLAQAIGNLIGNALKFVAPGEPPRIEIWTEGQGARVRLFVRDHGIGIPAESAHRIFEMFDRGGVGKEYEGTGIGLAIVKKAVERVGGTVSFTSAPGEGTVFCIDLPGAK